MRLKKRDIPTFRREMGSKRGSLPPKEGKEGDLTCMKMFIALVRPKSKRLLPREVSNIEDDSQKDQIFSSEFLEQDPVLFRLGK